jgi:hypothetical protein
MVRDQLEGRLVRPVILGFASLLVVITPPLTGSSTASTCAWDAGNSAISVMADDGATTTLVVSGSDILVEGTLCHAGATTATVNSIAVAGGPGPSTVVIDLSGGPFAPGATDEAPDFSEIEFTLDLGGDGDTLRILGTAGPDDWSLGEAG